MKKYIVLVLTLGLFAAQVSFADHSKDHKGASPEWLKYTQPGEGHAIFKSLVGTWKASTKWWMDAAAKAEESSGTSTNKLILDGRFLQSDFKGMAMGKPFSGIGMMGFDNVTGQYQSTWIDSMSTSMMISTGSYDTATKTINETGSGSCAMTGEKEKWYRGEVKFIDAKNYSYTMYAKGADGKEFKSMEILYKK